MQSTLETDETANISQEKLTRFISRIFGGTNWNPNPDEPLKPGPWDPVIRKTAKRIFGPHPDPWRLGIERM